jgi:hypothetical protein
MKMGIREMERTRKRNEKGENIRKRRWTTRLKRKTRRNKK